MLRFDRYRDRLKATLRRHLGRLEGAACVALLLLVLAGAAPFVFKMATTSLWTDELYSISNFSSKGLLTSLTNYHAPNNHILFNALNSLVPGSGSVQPYRARLVSLIAVTAVLVILLSYFHRRDRDLEATLCAAMLFNYGFLQLTLQARGYGLTALFGLIATVSTMEYLRRPSTRALVALAAAAVLGAWAIPTFILYAGILLLLLFASTRDVRVFYAGLATAVIVVGVYLPVLRELLEHSLTFSEEWGMHYATFHGLSRTIRYYLPPRDNWSAFLLLGSALIAPAWIRRRSAFGPAVKLLALSILLFLVVCMRLATPLVRTTSFIVIPIAIVLVVSLGDLLRRRRTAALRPWVAVAALAFVALDTYPRVRWFRFTPLENWKGTAEAVELVFPNDLPLYGSEHFYWLADYLQEPFTVAKSYDQDEFELGRQVYLETSLDTEKKAELRSTASTHAVISRPQSRGEEQLILVHPPLRSLVRSVAVAGRTSDHRALTDRSRATSWPVPEPATGGAGVLVRVELENAGPLKSAVVLWGDCPLPAALRASVAPPDGTDTPRRARIHAFDDVLVVALDDRPVKWLELEFEPGSPCLDELWVYPSRRLPE